MLKPGLWDWQGYLGFGVWANPGWKPYSLLGCQVGTSKKPDTLTYFQALCGSQKLRVWICIHIYLYICVRFELKFSTGQVAPKLDSPVQNQTPGNPTLYQKLLKHNLLSVNMPRPMAKNQCQNTSLLKLHNPYKNQSAFVTYSECCLCSDYWQNLHLPPLSSSEIELVSGVSNSLRGISNKVSPTATGDDVSMPYCAQEPRLLTKTYHRRSILQQPIKKHVINGFISTKKHLSLDDVAQGIRLHIFVQHLAIVVSEMTYTVLSGTLNSTIPYHTI